MALRQSAAAFVATPVQQALRHRDAPHKLRGMIAVRRHQHVVAAHRRGHADADRFLAQRGRERADLAGTLHRDGLEIELPGQHHGAIERQQGGRIAGKVGKVGLGRAVGER
jgi:hypothetical protein